MSQKGIKNTQISDTNSAIVWDSSTIFPSRNLACLCNLIKEKELVTKKTDDVEAVENLGKARDAIVSELRKTNYLCGLHANSSMTGFLPLPTVIGRPAGEIAGFSMFMPAAKAMLACKAPTETASSST